MTSREWYYFDSNKWIGPFTDQGLKTLVADGVVVPETKISLAGKVVMAEKVAGLFLAKASGFPVVVEKPASAPAVSLTDCAADPVAVRPGIDTKYMALLGLVVLFGVITLINTFFVFSSKPPDVTPPQVAASSGHDTRDFDSEIEGLEGLHKIVSELADKLDDMEHKTGSVSIADGDSIPSIESEVSVSDIIEDLPIIVGHVFEIS